MREHLHPPAQAIIQGPKAHIAKPTAYQPELPIGFKAQLPHFSSFWYPS
jgi:hypothetical protein